MNSNQPLISVKNLKKYYQNNNNYTIKAVDDVSLDIYPGHTLGIVGESGCGKSTLGRVMLRLVEPTEGEIRYKNTDLRALNKKEMMKMRKELQIIFQDPFDSLDGRMTTFEIIAEPLKIHKAYKNKADLEKQVLDMMELVGLPDYTRDLYPHEMDGGRRQRIGIARALILKPTFVVCDEPVSALDVSIQAQILNLLQDLQKEMNLTYAFISHNLAVIKHMADNIAVIYAGQIVEYASKKQFFAKPMHPYSKVLLDAIPVPRLKAERKAVAVGEINNYIVWNDECRFANRCPLALEGKCPNKKPELHEVEPGHFVRCDISLDNKQ